MILTSRSIFSRNEPPNPAEYSGERPELSSHVGKSRKATRKPNQLKEQKVKSLKFFKPTLATTLAIVIAWLLSARPAQAGYTVTLQQVGPDVVATGTGAIDLTGLTFSQSGSLSPWITPGGVYGPWSVTAAIYTGPTSSSVDFYTGQIIGPKYLGSPFATLIQRSASSGSGDMVGIYAGDFVMVPTGYVSGTALSDSATYSGATLATLRVTPGTYYAWTWGTGANQNFTLQIEGVSPTPTPTATPSPGQSAQMDGEGTIAGRKGRQVQFFIQDVKNEATTDFLKGEFGYSDHKSHVTFTTGEIQTVTINGNQGAFTGMAHIGGEHKKRVQFTVSVTANQNPATGDTFSIVLSNGYTASGFLTSGSITIHTLGP
jgi:hypothetical protein